MHIYIEQPRPLQSHSFHVFYWILFVSIARQPWVELNSCRHNNGLSIDGISFDSNAVQHDQTNSKEIARNRQSKAKLTIFKYNNQTVVDEVHAI